MECPKCHREIHLVPKPGDPSRVQGFCSCTGVQRCVIETNSKPVKTGKKGKTA
jgi:hypothetical protein